jgi:cytochrome c oxidase assembly protein subunit 15
MSPPTRPAAAGAAGSPWLSRFAWFTAGATLLLICSGGMVTSKGAGLAVPDWPTTFGYNMFLFPVSKWVGGILFEHTHRLMASTVGVLTTILALWLWRRDPRPAIRNLGWLALGAVVLQGVLGGLRVTLLKDEIGIFHACLAHAFFALLVVIALSTSGRAQRVRSLRFDAPALRRAALVTTIFIYLQLILGATMRHEHRDLSIPDFPLAYGRIVPDTSPRAIMNINAWRDTQALSDVTPFQIWLQMAHRFGASLVALGVIVTCTIALRHNRRLPSALTRLCLFWFAAVCTQLLLGAWTIWSNKAADIATAHVAVGAIMLSLGVVIVYLSFPSGSAPAPGISARRQLAAV